MVARDHTGVVAPNVADKLDTGWLIGAGASALVGLLALLYGTWQAMSAAFGVPGDAVIVTGRGCVTGNLSKPPTGRLPHDVRGK
jgi:hypothetical protein